MRVLPDGGYEQYSQGKLVSRNGQDLREADRMQQHAGKETRVLSCVDCSGNGCKTDTVDGIVRERALPPRPQPPALASPLGTD